MPQYNICMKATLKNVTIALSILAVVVSVLLVYDAVALPASGKATYLRVTVVDLGGNPVHNAKVTMQNMCFLTDNKGRSPAFDASSLTNIYDETLSEWKTATIAVSCEGYVPAVALNCIVQTGQTRNVTVKLYRADDSDLPVVCYVESPPDAYLQSMFEK